MLTVLSLFDDRSRPKGSRDPLGIEAIWSFLGRKVVGNLTTVTSNLDNFIVALLCCRHSNAQSTELGAIQEAYMRAEQLAAYLRLAQGNDAFLGVTRARANHRQGLYPLGISAEAQILSNQLSYGLWGLYSTAMQVAGLIEGAERKPTLRGVELIDRLLAQLGKDGWQDFEQVVGKEIATPADIQRLAVPFREMLSASDIRLAMANALLGWQASASLQSEMFRRAREYLGSKATASASVRHFCAWLLDHSDTSVELKRSIKQIRAVEPLLVLAATVMNWLQGQRNRSRSELVDDLQLRLTALGLHDAWKAVGNLPHKGFLTELLGAAGAGDARELIDVLLRQNRAVMRQRGGAPWLEWEGDRLKVRVTNDRAMLPKSLAEHCQSWENSYFIGSFLSIAREAVR
jgi:hypothetical protein